MKSFVVSYLLNDKDGSIGVLPHFHRIENILKGKDFLLEPLVDRIGKREFHEEEENESIFELHDHMTDMYCSTSTKVLMHSEIRLLVQTFSGSKQLRVGNFGKHCINTK